MSQEQGARKPGQSSIFYIISLLTKQSRFSKAPREGRNARVSSLALGREGKDWLHTTFLEESYGHHRSFSVAPGQSQGANLAQRTTVSVSKSLCSLEDKLCTFLPGVSQNPLVSLGNPINNGWCSHWQKPKQAVKHGSFWDTLPGPSSQPHVCYHHRCPLRNLLLPPGECQLQRVPTPVRAPPFLSG